MEDITPFAIELSLPATFVTPCRTLSLTSSKSGVVRWLPLLLLWLLPVPKKSADEMLNDPSNLERFALRSHCKITVTDTDNIETGRLG